MAKGGYRGGMPMGGMNQMQMMKQAQKMQENLMKMQEELQAKEYEANGRRYYHFDQVYPLATIRDSIAALYAEGARRGYELADTVVTLNIIDQFSEGHPGSYVTALETRILPA